MPPHTNEAKTMPSLLKLSSLTFVLTLIILFCVFALSSITPFGDGTNSLAVQDAWNQYLDLFSYLSNVLNGEDYISYTLNKGLGGTGVATFSYYLSSPFNFLFALVPTESYIALYDIIVALKLALAGALMTVFLCKRFANLSPAPTVALSLSYALMEYSLAQSINIMWLDGVYMLPVILLAVYRLVESGRIVFLSCAAGLAILFNWYTGAINCLFACVWFVVELSLHCSSAEKSSNQSSEKLGQTHRPKGHFILTRILRFAIAMVLAVGISAVLFVPTALELLGGRASSGWMDFDFGALRANPLFIATGIVMGSVSSETSVSLYCGSLAIICALAFLLQPGVSKRRKLILALLAILCLLAFYWEPLYAVFSLFQTVESFWCRFAYVLIFGLIFIAANYLDCSAHSKWSLFGMRHFMMIPAAVIICFAMVVVNLRYRTNTFFDIALTCAFILLVTFVVCLYDIIKSRSKTHTRSLHRTLTKAALTLPVLVICIELGMNSLMVAAVYAEANVEERSEYTAQQSEQIDAIQSADTGLYRITQTSSNHMRPGNLTANYNEGLAYGYLSLTSYTSAPSENQRELLEYLGYRKLGANISVVNTSILGSDSLLGVKYVLSEYPIEGLITREDLPTVNDKMVYENPYALPLAFLVDDSVDLTNVDIDAENTFELQNQLYSELIGESVELYTALDAQETVEIDQDTYTASYEIELDSSEAAAVYGYFAVPNEWSSSTVMIGDLENYYSQWLSPNVLYIPSDELDSVSITASIDNYPANGTFYALNISELERCYNAIVSNGVPTIEYSKNQIVIDATTDQASKMVLSIPYDDGWTIYVNGEVVEPEQVLSGLMVIELQEGENHIEMRYAVQGFAVGLTATLVSLAVLVCIYLVSRRRTSRHAAMSESGQMQFEADTLNEQRAD